jgi:hypothetical protein
MIDPQTIADIASECHSGRGAPAKLPIAELIASTVYHELQPHGTQAQHTRQLTGKSLTDGALSLRRQQLDARVFRQVLDAALHPLADLKQHPEAFYHGLRLLGIDGTRFCVPNTEPHQTHWDKTNSRRGKAAFALIDLAVLSELGFHNPIAAAIAQQQESEMALARTLFPCVPPDSLILGDRYYGVGKCVAQGIPLWLQQGSHFLFRVRRNLKRTVLKRFRDGSARVRIQCADGTQWEVREICATVRRGKEKSVDVRLWTSLLDARKHPAAQLLALYAQRWEQELATDELKNKLHGGHRLRSQTPETAVQEMAALVLAQGIVARVRVKVAGAAQVPTLRVSFGKTLSEVQTLWRALQWGNGVLNPKQVRALVEGCMESLEQQLTMRRRKRNCPRAVRQPVSSWPRLLKTKSVTGPIEYAVVKI